MTFNASVSGCTSLFSFLKSFDINPSVDDAVDSRVAHSSTSDSYVRICHGIQKRVFIGNSSSASRKQNDYSGKGEDEQNQHDSCSFQGGVGILRPRLFGSSRPEAKIVIIIRDAA